MCVCVSVHILQSWCQYYVYVFQTNNFHVKPDNKVNIKCSLMISFIKAEKGYPNIPEKVISPLVKSKINYD